MSEPICHYHPERKAKEKCEKCGKLICLECEMVFHQTRSRSSSTSTGFRSGSRSTRSSYNVRYEVCPVCYYELQEETVSASKAPMMLGIGFMIVFMLIFFTSFLPFVNEFNDVSDETGGSPMSPMFMILPIFMMLIIPGAVIIFFILRINVVGPKKASEARANKEAFLKSVGQNQSDHYGSSQGSSRMNKSSGFCSYCGGELEPDDRFCLVCGKERK